MIKVAKALEVVFQGMTIPFTENEVTRDLSVQFHYGDNSELIMWIKERGTLQKYPLIWYVLDKCTELNGVVDVNCRLVIMAHTKYNEMNNWRSVNTYPNIIYPVNEKIKEYLALNPYVNVYSKTIKDKFIEKDEPKYGVKDNNNEQTKSDKSVPIDIVDAQILTFKMRIKADCIINKNI